MRIRPVTTALLVSAMAGSASAAFTERVSVGLGGVQGNGPSESAVHVSADGRYVVFSSGATNLGLGSPYGAYLRDRATETTTEIAPYAAQAITPDFQTIVFTAYSGALVPGDTNNASDVFVYERSTGTVERVSVATGGAQAFQGDSFDPRISADGRLVAFLSYARNLVANDNNYDTDVFVHDRATGVTERVSVASDGSEGTAGARTLAAEMTPDGRFLTFFSRAANLAPGGVAGEWNVYVRDRATATTELVSYLPDGSAPGIDTCCSGGLSITPDGRYVAFVANLGPPNYLYEVFVRDRAMGTTVLASEAMGGGPSLGFGAYPSLSADGRFVAFESGASDLVPGDTNGQGGFNVDVFVRDLVLGTIERASVATDGTEAELGSVSAVPRISADGHVVAFVSTAANLVGGDSNGAVDLFVRDRTCGDGAPDPAEGCDDGNNTDGDGCDANCQPTGCGNGRATGGEACDDGVANGTDDCCSATCTPVDGDGDGICDARDACTAPAATAAKLVVSGLITSTGDRLAVSGRLALPTPVDPPLDPSTNGVRVLVTDASAHTVFDATVPGGAGWRTNGSGTVWKYTALTGIVSLKVQMRGAFARVALKGKGVLFSGLPASAPLAATVFLHPTDDAARECGEVRGTCIVGGGGDHIQCR